MLLKQRFPGRRAIAQLSSLLRPGKRTNAAVSAPVSPAAIVAARQTERRGSVPAASAHSRGSRRRRIFRIKNMRRALIACGVLAGVVTGAVLLATLTGDKTQQAAVQNDAATVSPKTSDASSQATAKLASVSVVTPVYESVRISQGVTATVVGDVQGRLMELGYMDADEPDSVYGNQTTDAVNHFKTQHGLEADGVVDEQTYALLFSDEAQYYTITIGARDNDVYELQQRLTELGYMDKSTGYFGEETETAVKKFQKLNHLNVDGRIGRDTHEMLYSDDVVANFYTYGEKSDEILEYQKRLKALGYLTTEPDGSFGGDTKAAVQRFQEANGIIANGHIGPVTAAALMSSDAQSKAFAVGSRGDQVATIQQKLKKLGYFSGNITGYFGSATETAVRKFQKRNGLTQDGRVGRQTMNVLMSSNAKKAATSSSHSSSGSNSGSSSGSGSGSGSSANITGANVESFISVAESKLGREYTRGAKGPNEFDCSGFVYWCLNQVGVKQGYMTSYTWRSCSKYTRIENMSDLQRGDVIVYKGHVGICAGNGYMIDASSSNDKVVKRRYTDSSYWSRNFICGYRIF